MLFREASRGLEWKLSHISWGHSSFQFTLSWRGFVAVLHDEILVRCRLGQVLYAHQIRNRGVDDIPRNCAVFLSWRPWNTQKKLMWELNKLGSWMGGKWKAGEGEGGGLHGRGKGHFETTRPVSLAPIAPELGGFAMSAIKQPLRLTACLPRSCLHVYQRRSGVCGCELWRENEDRHRKPGLRFHRSWRESFSDAVGGVFLLRSFTRRWLLGWRKFQSSMTRWVGNQAEFELRSSSVRRMRDWRAMWPGHVITIWFSWEMAFT